MAKSKKNWIAAATENKGTFAKKAKKAGMSTSAFATKSLKKKSKASATTKKEANLANTLAGLRKKKKK